MNIFDKVLSREEFKVDPPIIIDIGASESLPKEWRRLAKYSICIAFDADNRDTRYLVNEKSKFRKLYTYNRIVSDKTGKKKTFYLTDFPYCSSSLEPNTANLKNWDHYDLFRVKKKDTLNSITLPAVLKELNIKKVDWFKTDSQGTDLRLFKSLGDSIINKVLVADFEPGIIDAYRKEDKLHQILAYMDNHPFFVSDIKTGGSIRINEEIASNKFSNFQRKILSYITKKSPCWVEISYLNIFKNVKVFSKRDFLLGWIFALIKSQLGFSLELAVKGKEKFNDPIFLELERHSLKGIKNQINLFPLYFFKQICPLHR